MSETTRTIEELLSDPSISQEDKEYYKENPECLDGQICPVCGEYRFLEDGNYEYCPVCGWQDDRVQREDPDYEGGANGVSLNEFKEEYAKEFNNN